MKLMRLAERPHDLKLTVPFRPRRHLLSAADYRQVMADRFAVWNEITGATTTAAA